MPTGRPVTQISSKVTLGCVNKENHYRGFIVAHSSRVLSITAEEAWYQEREAAGLNAFAVRQKAVVAHAQLAFVF